MTRAYQDKAVWLLRRLAGRVDDGALANLRNFLGAREMTMMETTLLIELRYAEVPLSPAEESVLRDMLDNPDDPGLKRIPRWNPDAAERLYEFSSSHPGADEPGTERRMVEWASGDERVRRVLKAWRRPATSSAKAPEGWTYVVEVGAVSDVPGAQSTADVCASGMGRVEVVAVGEELPAYQAAALAAGQQLWPWP